MNYLSARPSDYEVSPAAFTQFQKPCVYAWVRNGAYLYVGVSKRGFSRPLNNHHVIGTRDAVQEIDTFKVWTFNDAAAAVAFEAKMIRQCVPLYNRLPPSQREPLTLPPKLTFEPRVCPYCSVNFIPTKENQEYCQPNHRKKAWLDRTYVRRTEK